MVRLENLSIIGLLVLLVGCASVERQEVVSVESLRGGEMQQPSTRKRVTPTPPAVFVLLEKSAQAMHNENWVTVFRYLEQAQRLGQDAPEVYLAYGEAYLAQGKMALAEAMFKRVLALTASQGPVARQAKRYLSGSES